MCDSRLEKRPPLTALNGGVGVFFATNGEAPHFPDMPAYVCTYAITMDATVSFARLISWLTIRVMSLICCRWLPFQAFLDTLDLPSSVFAPVDISQGFQVLMSSDCLALRSTVQLFINCS